MVRLISGPGDEQGTDTVFVSVDLLIYHLGSKQVLASNYLIEIDQGFDSTYFDLIVEMDDNDVLPIIKEMIFEFIRKGLPKRLQKMGLTCRKD